MTRYYRYEPPTSSVQPVKIAWFKLACVILFLITLIYFVFSIVTYEKPTVGTNYKTETTWSNPVVDIKDCRSRKYSYSCLVLLETESQYIRRDFRYWPGNTIQLGDKLGYEYRIGEKYVEKWRMRSSSNMMRYVHICEKTSKSCDWPGKNAPKIQE